jgi:tellurite resistance protein TehA-like permease
MGVLKYLALVFSLGLILYTIFVSVFPLGIMATAWLLLSHGVDLKWWQYFLICAAWGPIAMLLDVGVFYTMALFINLLGVSSKILPKRFRKKLDTFNER